MKYSFAEITVKTIRLHEQSAQPCDLPHKVKELWDQYVTKSDWYDPDKEAVVVFLLNTRLNCIGFNLVSIGSLNEAMAYPREIFRAAIAGAAHSIILANNHPSGDCDPSEADRRLTRRVREAGETIGIPLVDHVVVGDSFWSFREHGLI